MEMEILSEQVSGSGVSISLPGVLMLHVREPHFEYQVSRLI